MSGHYRGALLLGQPLQLTSSTECIETARSRWRSLQELGRGSWHSKSKSTSRPAHMNT